MDSSPVKNSPLEIEGEPTVLIVEDERDLADLHETWLSSECVTKTAYDGEQALELVDDDVDIGLIDRRMPGIHGDEVVNRIRERGYDFPVVMVSAVTPDFDVIDVPFDDYVTKPVDKSDLIEIINRFVGHSKYDEQVRAHLALVSKRDVLRTELDGFELERNAEYAELERRIARSREQLDPESSNDVLVEFLREEMRNRIYTVLSYDEGTWVYRYVNDSVEELIADLDSHLDDIQPRFQQEGSTLSSMGNLLRLGGHSCSLHLFDKMVLIHFAPTDHGGVLCGFDPAAASNLTEFVTLVQPYIEQAGLTTSSKAQTPIN